VNQFPCRANAGEVTVGEDCALSEEHFLKDRLGRLRDVRIDQAGALYVLTDGSEGMLYRLDRISGGSDSQPRAHL
jgi:glucose/arabinose dehydrogenase